jgi:hypothetical protein
MDIASTPLVISFYTENTPYQLEALTLIQSLRTLQIEADVVGLPSRKTWAQNCAIKPFFIQEKLREHKRPVFWVDVDAVFLKKPDFSEMLGWDIGVRAIERMHFDPRFKYVSGSLFCNYTSRALRFIDAWCSLCAEALKKQDDPVCLDQTSLASLIDSGFDVSIYPLPVAYAKIFDLDSDLIEPEEVIVEHHQASRLYKNLLF